MGDPVTDPDAQLLELAMPLVAERINKLTEAAPMLGFLFVDEADFERDPADVAKLLDDTGRGVVQASYDALAGLHEWSTAAIEDALRVALIKGMELGHGWPFGPVRVAGDRQAHQPPLFESTGAAGPRAQPRAPAVRTGLTPWRHHRPPTSGRTTTSCTGWGGPDGGARCSAPSCSWCSSSASCPSPSACSPWSRCSRAAPSAEDAGRGSSTSPRRSRRRGWRRSTSCSDRRSSSWLVLWLFHRLKPRWLSSVAPRLRWPFLLACLPVAVVALVASFGVAFLVPAGAAGEPVGAMNDFTSTTRDFLLVIALLTPLQAAEEGVRLPRLPDPGVRLPPAVPTGVARARRARAVGAVRARPRVRPELAVASSTGSPSVSSPAPS